MTIKKTTALLMFMLTACLAGCVESDETGFLGSGSLEATEVIVSAQTTGTLIRLTREEGQPVSTGDLLARIDVEKLELQRSLLEASLQEVEAGRLAAEAEIAQAKENLANLEIRYGRIKELHARGSATRQQLDDLATQVKVAAAGLTAARSRLPQLDAGAARIEAEKALLERQIADGLVYSPLPGLVVEKYMEKGETAVVGGRLYKIADLNSFWLNIYVAAEDLGRIIIGEKVTVKVDAIDTPLSGVVRWVSPQAEFTPKNVQTRKARSELVYAVKVVLEEGVEALKIGMPAEVFERL